MLRSKIFTFRRVLSRSPFTPSAHSPSPSVGVYSCNRLLLGRQWGALPPPSFSTLAPTSSEHLDKFEASPASGSVRVFEKHHAPIVIYWNLENYDFPPDMRPGDVAENIRLAVLRHPAIKGNIVRFSAYANFKRYSWENGKRLHDAGVQLRHVPCRSKHKIDKHMLADIYSFTYDNPPSATIMLICGLVEVAFQLGDFGYKMILVNNVDVSSMHGNDSVYVCDWQSVMRGQCFSLPSLDIPSAEGHLKSSNDDGDVDDDVEGIDEVI